MEPTTSGLSTIGLDVKALIFQVVNFAILLWLLKRFAYKPIVSLLEARRRKIEESLKTADAIAAERSSLDSERTQRINQAEAEAATILAQSKQESATLLGGAEAKGRAAAEELRSQAVANIEQERQRVREAVKAETLQLVKKATEHLLRQKLDSEADEKLIRQALKEVQTT